MELPNDFIIRMDIRNPLWEKYINWLNKTYNKTFTGLVCNYYGVFNNKTCIYDIRNDIPDIPIITLKEWNEAINSYKLPENWKVLTTEANWKVVFKWAGFRWENGIDYYVTSDKSWKTKDQKENKYTIISFEIFKKYVLKETEMKTIIGYKLIKPEYKEAANKIVTNYSLCNDDDITSVDGFPTVISLLKDAGVLDIWFEPVYEDEKIMLDNSKYEIVVTNGETSIDGYVFSNNFWICAKVIAQHSKADVVLGCGSKNGESSINRWSVSLETINKVLDRIS